MDCRELGSGLQIRSAVEHTQRGKTSQMWISLGKGSDLVPVNRSRSKVRGNAQSLKIE